ncbi:putative membrane protein [Oikeobacillus pervagus]|uniref:Membrane protein n=1 Tax=Oikeobacillus pervagus TaxID=1325931 RepID=A0AAJ1T513_9BACI|nr:YhgE/Pip domain-containing protein [Oikeobacillus pervagus]MDQ0215331.1 putative membrane protein [Oikeobacillus pervagus]
MIPIFSIYSQDIKRIVTNWVALVIISGLAILPSLYAWFNIKASWDPYGNTEGVAIAVSNLDEGATILDQQINIGDQIVDSLKSNKKLGWTFVSEDNALHGVQHGDYYASITIPKDFSKKIATVVTDEPTKAEIVYHVNEKINAIAPKISSKGASGIIEAVSSNFIKTANGTIFKIFNELGIELEKELPTIETVKNYIFQLERSFPEIKRILNVSLDDINEAEKIVKKSQVAFPTVTKMVKEGQRYSNDLNDFMAKSEKIYDELSPAIKQDFLALQEMAHSGRQFIGSINFSDIGQSSKDFTQFHQRLETNRQITEGLISVLTRLQDFSSKKIFENEINQLNQVRHHLLTLDHTAKNIHDKVLSHDVTVDQLICDFNDTAYSLATISTNMVNRFDSNIKPKINQSIQHAKTSLNKATVILNEANQAIPHVEKILEDAAKGVQMGKGEIKAIQTRLPYLEKKITQIANDIRQFEDEADIGQIIELLKNDVQKESNFFAEPVILKEHKFFPIPNYGSAMSPFFTTLALWVGALLLISLLTVEVHGKEGEFKSYQIYLGRLLTFLTIALIQSLIVTVGDIYLLKAYVVDRLWFVLFGLFISAVFMIIVYTFVSVFGNVGKALAIVFLVLQLAGSGGTFPIQVTPAFFQAINPYLPFTYAISMMREAVGGILWDIVHKDVFYLIIFTALALLLGLALKNPINRTAAKLIKKAKESELIH